MSKYSAVILSDDEAISVGIDPAIYIGPQGDASEAIADAEVAAEGARDAEKGARDAERDVRAALADLEITAMRIAASRWNAHQGPASLLTFRPAPGSPMQVTCDKAGEVWAGGRNLFGDIIRATLRYVTLSRAGGAIRVTRSVSGAVAFARIAALPVSMVAGKTFTVRGTWTVSGQGVAGIYPYWMTAELSDISSAATRIDASGETRTFTVGAIPQGAAYLGLFLYADTGSASQVGEYVDYTVQLELGSQATSYEPYVGTTHPITPNTPIEITAVPGVNHLIASAGTLKVDYNRDSMDVLDKLTDPVTDTGSVASIGGAIDDRPLAIVARAVATGGGGTPEEPIPIVGKPVVTPWRGGRNIWKPYSGEMTKAGITISVAADGTVTLNGIATATADFWIPHFMPQGIYTISLNNPTASADVRLAVRNRQGSTIGEWVADSANKKITATLGQAVGYARVAVYQNAALNNFVLRPQLEPGPTATSYEPYTGATFPIPAPAGMEFYGLPGAPDEIVIGADGRAYWVKRTEIVALNGTEDWSIPATQPNDTAFLRVIAGGIGNMPAMANNGGGSHFKFSTVYAGYITAESWGYHGTTPRQVNIYILKTRLTTPDAAGFKAWLAAQNAAGTPAQVLYELAAPQIIPLDDVIIPSLLGTNQVYSDGGGDTTVTGRRGAAAVWDKLDAMQARITALEALTTTN